MKTVKFNTMDDVIPTLEEEEEVLNDDPNKAEVGDREDEEARGVVGVVPSV